MRAPLAQQAGHAVAWRGIQLASTKGIFLARTLILARLLSPDDFGVLAIATAAIAFLMSITDLGMTPALVQRRTLEDAHYDSAWTVNLARALGVSAVLMVAAPAVATLFGEPRAAGILRLLALKPLLDASASIKMSGLTRQLNYRRLALVSLPAALVDTLVAVSLATTLGVGALVAGALTAALTAAALSYVVAPHRPRLRLVGDALRPLVRYGRWIFLTRIVAVFGAALTQLAISRQLGPVELGLYFLAAKLAFLPHELASQVAAEVGFSLYARIQDDLRRVATAFRSVLLGLMTILVPIYVILIALAPMLVAEILGDRWRGTESLIQLLALAGIAGLFGDATGPLFRGLDRPSWNLAVELVQSCLVIALVWSLTGHFGAKGAALAWAVAICSSQIMSFLMARRILPRPLTGAVLPALLLMLASLLGASTALATYWVAAGPLGLLFASAVACGVTATTIWVFDARFKLGLRTDLVRAFPQLGAFVGLTSAPSPAR